MKIKPLVHAKHLSIFCRFYLLSLIFLVSACSGRTSDEFIDDPVFYLVPLKSNIDQVQPMTGIVFWNNNTKLSSLGNIVQLEYSYMIYSDIVSEKGIYDWSVVDKLLADVASRGHQAILRFRYTYPGITYVSVPSYLENSEGFNSSIVLVEGKRTYIPDWSFAGLERFTLDFFSAFTARYDNDPRVAFLQVGFGSYSEYHLYDGPVSLGNNFPSKVFQAKFLRHLDASFEQLHWSISIDAADSSYTPIANDSDLVALKFGVFDDSFMHESHSENDEENNRSNWLFFGKDKFKNSPAGGEFSYYSAYDQANVLNTNIGAYGKSFEYFVGLYNITYIIGNDQTSYQTNKRIKQASMATGYKFAVEDFKASDTTSLVTIKNTGVAPIYYDAYPSVNGVRATESLKGLLPNKTMTFTILSGGTNLELVIESDRLVKGQVIQFDADL